jgi:hypothetical protein
MKRGITERGRIRELDPELKTFVSINTAKDIKLIIGSVSENEKLK